MQIDTARKNLHHILQKRDLKELHWTQTILKKAMFDSYSCMIREENKFEFKCKTWIFIKLNPQFVFSE